MPVLEIVANAALVEIARLVIKPRRLGHVFPNALAELIHPRKALAAFPGTKLAGLAKIMQRRAIVTRDAVAPDRPAP